MTVAGHRSAAPAAPAAPAAASVERVPLTRERIVTAALGLVDTEGLNALSMRKLGAALDVEAMSLYNHVANKDDLLDAILERLLTDVEVSPSSGSWGDQLRALARSLRQVGHAHPRAFALVVTRPIRSVEGFGPLERAHAILLQAGLGARTHDAFHSAAAFVIGFIQLELGGLYQGDDSFEMADLPAARFPNLVRLGSRTEHLDPDDEFELGLDILIGGLTALADSSD